MELARFFVRRGALNFNAALSDACEGGSQPAIDYMLQCGASTCYNCTGSMEEHRHKYLESDVDDS